MNEYTVIGIAACEVKIYVSADSEEEAIEKIKNGQYDDIADVMEINTERFMVNEIIEE
jgi:hypothetical protein